MVNLYGRAQWQRLRKHQLAIEPLCRFCQQLGKVKPATVVDHVVPHRGDVNAFFLGALQSLCKPCHDRLKQHEERHGFMPGCGLDGMPLDPNHPAYQRR